MKYTSREIAKILDVTFVGDSDHTISQISIDSRTISKLAAQTIFVALTGNIVDGHRYVRSAYNKGVRVFLVNKKVDLPDDAIQLKVDNTLIALQKWATHHRLQFNIPVIAITGSNGKTITKEWLSQLLSAHHKVVKSPKSYNSQIGVPLSILQMDDTHEIGVFEAGISTSGEMANLENIIKPNICILTNIGDAHSAGFDGEGLLNLENKLKEKSKLFKNCDSLIYYKGDGSTPYIIDGLKWIVNQKKHHPYYYDILEKGMVTFHFYGKSLDIQMPFQDEASIQNLLASISVMCLLGIDIVDM